MTSEVLMWVSFAVAAVTIAWSIRSIAETRRMRREVAAERVRKHTAAIPVGGVMGDSFDVSWKCTCGRMVKFRLVQTPRTAPIGRTTGFDGQKGVVVKATP